MQLKDQTSIETAFFVLWQMDVPNTRDRVDIAFSDSTREFEIAGIPYSPLSRFLNITSSTSSIRSGSDRVTITLSALSADATVIKFALDRTFRVANSKVTVFRGLFDPDTGELLALPENPIRRFTGFASNFNLIESRNPLTNEAVFTFQLNCVSFTDFLTKKFSGRTTERDSGIFRNPDGSFSPPQDFIFQRTARLKGFTLNWGG